MNIGILGTGVVGQTLAEKLRSLGHVVVIGTRDVAATRNATAPGPFGHPAFSAWHVRHPDIALGTFAEAATAEVVFNCTKGAASLSALSMAGADRLAGKVLIDVSNPLDFSNSFPPSLFICNNDSLGELIQRTYPRTYVVKTLNTVNCSVMVDPTLAPGRHSVFLSGNDSQAKASARALLMQFGWIDIIDLGDISGARATEQLTPIWLRLWSVFGTADFNISVCRPSGVSPIA